MIVSCGNKRNGCQWKGENASLRNHEENCPYALVPCSNGCKDRILRMKLEKYLTCDCSKRYSFCKNCGKMETFENLGGHNDICDSTKVSCPQCMMSTQRGMLEEHKKKYCSKAKVECPYQGCGMELCKKELNQHFRKFKHWDKSKVSEPTDAVVEEDESASCATGVSTTGLASEESDEIVAAAICDIYSNFFSK